jgi:hypothetical protein
VGAFPLEVQDAGMYFAGLVYGVTKINPETLYSNIITATTLSKAILLYANISTGIFNILATYDL